ncbi:hypothetical protein T01_11542, partial [Trichinella spiralis]
MLLASRTLPGGYKSIELYALSSESHVSFPFLLFPLKSQHHATFLTISRQIRIYKSCDQ